MTGSPFRKLLPASLDLGERVLHFDWINIQERCDRHYLRGSEILGLSAHVHNFGPPLGITLRERSNS